MTGKVRYCLLALAVLLLASCGGKEEPTVDTGATIVPRKTLLDAGKGGVWVAVTARGDWSIELEYEPADTEPWASVDKPSGNGNVANVRLSYSANEGEFSRQLTMVLYSGGMAVSSVIIMQKAESGEGPGGGDGQGGGYGADTASAGWLELPATVAGDGNEFFVHSMDGGRYYNNRQSGVRNYSFYYDYDEYVSLWVAYPLNKSLGGSGDRTDAWGYDPLIPATLQQSITRGTGTGRYYADGQYDRGHQLPSADRLNYSANVSTFYATNMTPQTAAFNQGIWGNLEGRVRTYSSTADTLYVVTGCVLDGNHGHVKDADGHSIAVPSAYFKALLYRGSNSQAAATSRFMAAGFYLEHKSSLGSGNFLNYIVTIDELEARTGIDFFVNLPAEVGQATADKIEGELITSFWK